MLPPAVVPPLERPVHVVEGLVEDHQEVRLPGQVVEDVPLEEEEENVPLEVEEEGEDLSRWWRMCLSKCSWQ